MKHRPGKTARSHRQDDMEDRPRKIKSSTSEKRRLKHNLKKIVYNGDFDEFEELEDLYTRD